MLKRALLLLPAFAWVVPPPASAQMPPQVPTEAETNALRSQSEGLLSQARAARADLDRMVGGLEEQEDRVAALAGRSAVLRERLRMLEEQRRAAQEEIDRRAAFAYRMGGVELAALLLGARTFRQMLAGARLIASASSGEAKAMTLAGGARAKVEKASTEAAGQHDAEQAALAALSIQQMRIGEQLDALDADYQQLKAEFASRRSRFAFPVDGGYAYTDTWGAPREVGTPLAHPHQGTDIFARYGTPIVAVTDGVLERVGTDVLGGTKLWLRSPPDGWSYYYAHLSGYGPGVADAVPVRRGQVIGYVGNSGDAITTPPHLHFETHQPGGSPVDPYPILRRADPLLG